MMGTLQPTLLAIWQSDEPVAAKRARSDWVAFVFNAKQWSHRFESAAVAEIRCRGWALILAVLPRGLEQDVKEAYWAWLEEGILGQLKEDDPRLIGWLAEYGKTLFEESYQRAQDKAANNGTG